MHRIAIIDMGTNTFHLLIADLGASGYQIVKRDYEAVKIGVAGINYGLITDDACLRAIHAMKNFRKTMDEFHVSTVHAFATSAFRNASNGQSLAAEIETLTGIPVNIISGDVEADYIFEGIRWAIDLGSSPALIVDIGAGSVEFIIGSNAGVVWKQSFEIGGQRLLEKFHRHDPILPTEIVALNAYLEDTLAPLLMALARFNPGVLIGSSGTFDTLSDIFCRRHAISYDAAAIESPLTRDGFFEIYEELITKSRDERMQIPGMIPLRVDLIVVGCCIVRFLLEKHPFVHLRVSSWSLKEGVLATLAKRSP